jgi:TonB-dependent starch-binding outer membrane protein SusC
MKQKLLKSIGRAIPVFLVSMLLCTVAFAQMTVTGKVVGPDKLPVSGATVTLKGSNTATSTAADGSFSITIPNPRSVLVVSYIGYDVQEFATTTGGNLEIILKEKTTSLNEVVVTGYTSQAKKDITGAVAVVNTADLKSIPAANAEAQLQGRAAGVSVVTDNRPGAGSSVRIRGFASFTANNPLYIIDGVPSGGLGGLNPNDIETMQVLKDAASAAIYGARASNGVIIVTTKRGRQGSAKVAFNMYYGSQNPAKGWDLLRPQEMADLTWLAYKNAGQTPPSTQYGSGATPVLPDYILPAGKFEGDPAVNPDLYNLNLNDVNGSYLIHRANKAGTNWYDEITRNAPIQNYNVAVSGGADKSRYMMSLDYFDQQAVIINSFFKRYTFRVNTEFNVKNWLRIGQNMQLLVSEDNTVQNNGNNGEGSEIGFAYRNQSIIPVYDIKGNFAGSRAPGLGNSANPVAVRQRARDNRGQQTGVFGNIYAEVDFLRHFTARTSIGGQMNNGNYFYFNNITYENSENNTGNSYVEGFNRFRAWTWTNTVQYKNVFAEKHELTALVGTEAVEEWGRSIEGTRINYFIEDLNFRALSSGGASGARAEGSPYTPVALFSLFGQANYAYDNKYLASFSIRRDGSSRFGPNYRYGVFPAFSVGWRMSEENFMKDVKWVTDLKLRASWGQLGNQQGISAANAIDQYRSGPGSSFYDINGTSNSTQQGFQLSFVGNPNGQWERNTTTNIGFDGTFFNGKTEVIFDWYKKDADKLLLGLPGFVFQGAGPVVAPAAFNVGSMVTKGIDLMVTQRAMIGGKNGVNFSGTLTFTTYDNEITRLAEGIPFIEGRGSRIGNFIRNAPGQPFSSFFGYKVVGLFQDAADVAKSPTQDAAAPGRFKYADIDGDGRITDADRTFLGSPNPTFTYGLQLNAAWKGFDLGMFFYGAQGKEAMNYVKWWTDFFPSFQGNKSKDLLYNSWSPTNTGAVTPIAENLSNFSNNAVVNSYYLEDASYLRMKNLTIGYTLPGNLTNKVKIDKVRIYFQGTNLFTITPYKGLDPELIGSDGFSGVDEGIYPTVKQFLFGLNVNF